MLMAKPEGIQTELIFDEMHGGLWEFSVFPPILAMHVSAMLWCLTLWNLFPAPLLCPWQLSLLQASPRLSLARLGQAGGKRWQRPENERAPPKCLFPTLCFSPSNHDQIVAASLKTSAPGRLPEAEGHQALVTHFFPWPFCYRGESFLVLLVSWDFTISCSFFNLYFCAVLLLKSFHLNQWC